jgi:hypothetical protein
VYILSVSPYRARVILSVTYFMTVVAIASAQQGVTNSYALTDLSHYEITASNLNAVKLNYRAGEVVLTGLSNSYGDFYRISVPGHHSLSEPGKPELPVISKLVTTPAYSGYKVSYSNVRSVTIYPGEDGFSGLLNPAQPGATKSLSQEKQRFMIDTEYYKLIRKRVSDTVTVQYEGDLRGDRLSTITVVPAHYNPANNSIEIIISMDLLIEFESGTKSLPAGEEDNINVQSAQKAIKSYSHEQLINGYTDKPVGMIILTDTAFRKQIEPLVRWKTQKGFRVTTLYRGATLAGLLNTEIKDTLRKIYQSATPEVPAPEYLLIIGDLTFIPQSPGTSQLSDLYYGEFTGGGDYLPEMYIGRLPVKDTADARAVVSKILQYERFEFADTNRFYKNALITAGNDAGYATYMNGHINYASTYYINSANGLNATAWRYPESPAKDDSLRILINKGLGFLNYTGHGAADRWEDPFFSNRYLDSITTLNMYPFIVSNACRTGQFSLANNLATAFVLAKQKGAIGFIGCSNDSYWLEDLYYAVGVTSLSLNPVYSPDKLGFYDRLFHLNGELPSQWHYNMGQVNFAGNLAVTASTTSRKKYYWETYHLLGDPSLIPIIGEPAAISTNLPDSLPSGLTSLYITAPPFTYAAVSDGKSLWDASFVSPSGYVTLSIPETHGDSCVIVITGQNRRPLIRTLYFGEPSGSFINASMFTLDDSQGNSNGSADFGENIYLGMSLANLGNAVSADAYIKISSASEWVTIVTDSIFIGDIAAKSTLLIDKAFLISIKSSVPNKGIVSLTIMISDSASSLEYLHDIQILAPDISITGIRVDDLSEGNGNLIADRGETVNLVFTVTNTGLSAVSGLFRIMNTPDGLILHQTETETDIIAPESSIEVTIRATVETTTLPGMKIGLETYIDCGYYNDSRNFMLSVGKTRESFEYGGFALFPWINTSPVPWTITSGESYEGTMSAVSGMIGHNGVTTLKINIDLPLPDTIRFWYKVSSEPNYDFLRLTVNGSEVFKTSGEREWTQRIVLLTAGTHLLEWSYVKDGSVSSGSDRAWIDQIDFPESAFVERDIAVASILSPARRDDYGVENITVVVKNMGSRSINGFFLAYRVKNHTLHEWEYFNNAIPFRDSVTVTFSAPVDMSRYGIYEISVYGFDNDDDFRFNDTARITLTHVLTTTIDSNVVEPIIRAYPNPFNEKLNIFVYSAVAEKVSVTIEGISGARIYSGNASLFSGDNTLVVSQPQLQPGIYIISIRGDTVNHRIKVIKQ